MQKTAPHSKELSAPNVTSAEVEKHGAAGINQSLERMVADSCRIMEKYNAVIENG